MRHSEKQKPVRGGMYFSPFNQGHQRKDYLGAEARAVIDADFEEIHPKRPRKKFIESMIEGWIWIKQRLHRT